MKRSLRGQIGRWGASVIVLLMACALLAATVWWDNALNRGIAGAAPATPIPWADVPRGGVNTYGLHLEVVTPEQRRTGDNKVARTMEMIREGGFHWVRVQFPWEDIEFCAKGVFRDCRTGSAGQSMWTKYDYIVEQARRNDLQLIVRLDRPPPWARQEALASPEVVAATQAGYPVMGPPDRFEDYADFAGAIAARYGDDLQFYQIWNEPNLPGEWNYRRQDPAEFVRLLRLAGDAIKANDPDAVIVFPALSPTDGADGVATNDLDYLQGVYDAGGRDAFDIMSAQFYGLGQPPDEHRYVTPGDTLLRPIETRTDVSRVVLQREIMERNGDANKAVWVSELGWNSAPPGMQHQWGDSVSEETKARYLIGAMQRAQREWPWMGAMCVWMFRWGGEPPNPDDPTPYFQLVDFDFTPLPAYNAVRDYLAQSPSTVFAQPSPWPPVATLLAVVAVVAATTWAWSATLSLGARSSLAIAAIAPVVARRGRGMAQTFGGQTRAVVAGSRIGRLPRLHLSDRWILFVMLTGLAIFYRASAQLPLTLVGALIFVPFALLRPDLALLLVPLTVPLYLAPKGVWDARFGLSRPSGYFLPLHEFVLLLTLAGAALHHWRAVFHPRRLLALLTRHYLALYWLLAGTMGVVVATVDRGAALREWRWLVVEPLLFYALVLVYGRMARWRWQFVWAWLLTGVLLAVIGILQVPGLNLVPLISRETCFSEDVVSVEGVRRATSVYCHPNNLGLALGRVWPVLAAMALTARPPTTDHRPPETKAAAVGNRQSAGNSKLNWMGWLRWSVVGGRWSVVATVIVLLGIGASFSRGAVLGGVVALVVLGVALRRRVLLALACGVVVFGLLAVFATGVERFNPLGGSSSARLELWGSALAMLRDHPVTGVGLDQFYHLRNATPEGGRYMSEAAAVTSERYASHPHNAILDILLRTGPFGLLVMVSLVVGFFVMARRTLRGSTGTRRALVAGLLASMAGALVHGMFDNFYFVPDLAVAFWLQLALVELVAARPLPAEPVTDV